MFGGSSYAVSTPGSPSGVSNGASEACSGLTELGVDCSPGDPNAVAAKPIATIIGLLTLIVGVACVVMIIYGGFRFITSGGNSESTKAARNTIIYALVGLATVLLARTIVYFVFRKANSI